jgi:hypothetical protein
MAGIPPICDRCDRWSVVNFKVKPKEAFRTVVLNRWTSICAVCFDTEARSAGVNYSFSGVEAMSWSDYRKRQGSTAG